MGLWPIAKRGGSSPHPQQAKAHNHSQKAHKDQRPARALRGFYMQRLANVTTMAHGFTVASILGQELFGQVHHLPPIAAVIAA